MRTVKTEYLSSDECWGIQINGWSHCQKHCKWVGISACEGKNIVKTHYNSKGYKIDEFGINTEEYNPEYDQRKQTESA